MYSLPKLTLSCLTLLLPILIVGLSAQSEVNPRAVSIRVEKSAAIPMTLETAREEVDGYPFQSFVLKGDRRFSIHGTVDPRWEIQAEGRIVTFSFLYDDSFRGTLEVFPVGRAFPRAVIFPHEINAYVEGLKVGWMKSRPERFFELVEGRETDFFPTDVPKPREIRDIHGKLLGTIESESFPRMLGHDYFQLTYEWGQAEEGPEGTTFRNRTTEWWSLPENYQVRIRFTSGAFDHEDVRMVFRQYLKSLDFFNREADDELFADEQSN